MFNETGAVFGDAEEDLLAAAGTDAGSTGLMDCA
jgi:hypothetical protein